MKEDLSAGLAAALGDRYLIERELGRGGMATVYLANDLRHDRPVALKVLHPELAATLGPDRFLREIKLAARLQHPHILTVFDSGESGRRLWFTMPYVEGESLRARLTRDRQLPVEDAVRMSVEAAHALQYAHDHDVIHRDIKPENLLVTKDGHTLVADFGIGRALGGSDDRLTETGLTVGTPAYMSPEQAAGERAIDGRTDVYSLGAVMYEMLAGEPPFTGATAQAILAKRFTAAPPSVRGARPNVPEALDQAIRKALAPVPADRFASAAQFAQAIQAAGAATVALPTVVNAGVSAVPKSAGHRVPMTASALVLGILIGLGVLFAWRRSHAPADAVGTRFVAVLPFENVGDVSDEYFADGITDAVRGKLSGIPGLEIIAGRSSADYKKSTKPLAQIARELAVDYLVVAKIRWAKSADGASRVQVSPELIQIPEGGAATTRWQQPFDASMTDVFQVQADIAGRVVQALGVVLADSARKQLAEQPTASIAAYDAFLKAEAAGLGSSRVDPRSLKAAIALYQQAVQLDPAFGMAWARLSRATTLLYFNGVPSRELAEQARNSAERSLALAPKSPLSHVAMASFFRGIQQDNQRAIQFYAEARRLAPHDPAALVPLAAIEQDEGRHDSALAHLREASRLDPRSPDVAANLGGLLMALRRFPEADSSVNRARALSPGNASLVQSSVQIRLGQGDLEGARRVLSQAEAEIDPKVLAVYMATYNDLYWVLSPKWQSLVLQARPEDFEGDVGSWGLAMAQIYRTIGDRVRARAYADSSRAGFDGQLEQVTDPQTLALRGLALAYLGRTEEAVREAERAKGLMGDTGTRSPVGFYVQELLARIYVMDGKLDQAITQLEEILASPSLLSPNFLRLDPSYAPLRSHPRFKKLIGSP